jgi:hypothetical protein
MIKLKQLLLLFTALCLITLVSCDKDKDDNPTTKADLLTAGKWTGNKVYSGGQDITEMAKQFGFDVTKGTVQFRKDGTYSTTFEGDTEQGTWEFTQGESHIMLDNDYEVKINKLDSKNFFMYDHEDDMEIRYVR